MSLTLHYVDIRIAIYEIFLGNKLVHVSNIKENAWRIKIERHEKNEGNIGDRTGFAPPHQPPITSNITHAVLSVLIIIEHENTRFPLPK